MKGLVKVALVIVAVLLVGVVFLLLHDFDAPGLGQKVSTAVRDATGIDFQAKSFRLNVSKGLELESVTAKGELPGGTVSLSLDRLLLEHQLLPLLRGEVVVDRVLLDKPSIELVAKKVPPGTTPPETEPPVPEDVPAASSGGRELSLTVSEVEVADGTLLLKSEGEEKASVEVQGLDVKLGDIRVDPSASPRLLGLAGRGEIGLQNVRVKELSLSDAGGSFELGAGNLSVRDLGLSASLGRLVLTGLDVALAESPLRYKLALAADDLNLNELAGASGQNALGPARLQLTASGLGADTSQLVAEGTVSLQAGKLPSVGPLVQLDEIFETQVVGSPYPATDIHVNVKDNELEVQPFKLETAILVLSGHGTADFTGKVALTGDAAVPTAHHGRLVVPSYVFEKTGDAIHYRMSLKADSIDVNRIAGVEGQSAFGRATLEATALGDGPKPEDMKAEATIRLADGKIPSLPPLSKLDKILGTTIAGTAYHASNLKASLANNRVSLSPFELTSGLLKLGASGSIDLAGPLALALRVLVPRSKVHLERDLSNDVLDGLTDEAGWLGVPVNVTGVLADPKIAPDMDAIQKAAVHGAKKAVKSGIEKKVGEELGKLIHRKGG
jgi:hypothetical protein